MYKKIDPYKINCKRCGKESFTISSKKIFCSDECKGKYYQEKKRKNKIWPEMICRECGKVFTQKHFNQKMCSKECNLIRNKGMRKRICEVCGKQYRVNPSRIKTARFCSAKCWASLKKIKNFKERLFAINPELEVIGEYQNQKAPILVKDKNGIMYNSFPNELLKGCVPSLKTAIDKNKAFAILANLIHKNKYTYEKVEYCDTRKKVIITCRIHGDFLQKPVDHTRGSGCPACGLANTIKNLTTNHIGWNLKKWENSGLRFNGNPCLYIINVFDEEERFIKIGKTYQGIHIRFKENSPSLPYNFNIIKLIPGSYEYVYNKELELNKIFKKYKYAPNKQFHGHRECFTEEIKDLL